jgi:hypothetical protein
VTQDIEDKLQLDHEEIARRAHELYEMRGREDGHDVEDWTTAERQILEERGAGQPAKKRARPLTRSGR